MMMLSPDKPNKNIYFVAMLMAAVPTGGVPIVPQLGYSTANIHVISTPEGKAALPSQLANIRDSFGISATALCKIFGVSRQTYYNWANGEAQATASRDLLADLSAAADIIKGLSGSKSVLLSQPVRNGKSFWRLVSEGHNAVELAGVIRDRTARRANEISTVREAIGRKKKAGTLTQISAEFVG